MSESQTPEAAPEAAKPQPDKHSWPYGSLSIDLPEECVPRIIGDRIVFTAPAGLSVDEIQEWVHLQLKIQDRIQGWDAPEPCPEPVDDGFDVGAADTTREQLRELLAGQQYHLQVQAEWQYYRDIAEWEHHLSRLIWLSVNAAANSRIHAAAAASERIRRAREILRAGAPAELHARLAELEEERRQATYEINDKGQTGGHRIDYLRDRLASTANRREIPTWERTEWQTELTEREAKLARIEAETAEIERRMIAE